MSVETSSAPPCSPTSSSFQATTPFPCAPLSIKPSSSPKSSPSSRMVYYPLISSATAASIMGEISSISRRRCKPILNESRLMLGRSWRSLASRSLLLDESDRFESGFFFYVVHIGIEIFPAWSAVYFLLLFSVQIDLFPRTTFSCLHWCIVLMRSFWVLLGLLGMTFTNAGIWGIFTPKPPPPPAGYIVYSSILINQLID